MIRWCHTGLREMIEHGTHGRIDDLERTLFHLLALIAAVHEAISAAAATAGRADWVEEFEEHRTKDRTLRYLWKARDADVHDAIVKWEAGLQAMDVRIVDPAKANRVARQFHQPGIPADDSARLYMYLFDVHTQADLKVRLKRREMPKPERLESAGVAVECLMESIAFKPFAVRVKGKIETIREPDRHLGKPVSPAAHDAVGRAIAYYESRLAELLALAPIP